MLSKGHAAPILYAAWAAVGFIDRDDLLNLRQDRYGSRRPPDAAAALRRRGDRVARPGPGCSARVALNARRLGSDYRTYVLIGDGETAEGSVWEAAERAAFDKVDNLVGLTDVNRLGQSRPTMWQHDLEALARRWRAFGWHAIMIDGHDLNAILDALAEARATKGRPTMILAKTFKGYGMSFVQDKEGWHGRALKAGDEADRAIKELEATLNDVPADAIDTLRAAIRRPPVEPPVPARAILSPPSYKLGDLVATREAYGTALARLGKTDSRIVALDADVGNSTFSERFEKVAPERFYESYIAEQVMVGTAMGLAARGAIPFPSTFACFLTRAYDFLRMAAISNLNIKLAGSHAGVSIGEDGPSQMALEDLAMTRAEPNFTVLYPSDAVCGERCVELAAYQPGPVYIRRAVPSCRSSTITMKCSRSAARRSSASRRRRRHGVGAGVTLFEALKAFDLLAEEGVAIRVIDLYSVQPVDADTLIAAARDSDGRLVTVEDHYVAGGMGDAVATAIAPAGFTVHRLAVREIPRSGKPEELLDRFGISAASIVTAVKAG